MTTDQRLARVERQCRLFKAGFALMTVALAVVLLIGASQDQDKPEVLEEVRAKRFLVMDDAGIPYIVIGAPFEVPTSKPGSKLRLPSPSHRGISVVGKDGGNSISIGSDSEFEGARIYLSGTGGSISLAADETGSSLRASSKIGHEIHLDVAKGGLGGVAVFDPAANRAISLFGPNPDSGMGLFFLEADEGMKNVKVNAGLRLGKAGKAVLVNVER